MSQHLSLNDDALILASNEPQTPALGQAFESLGLIPSLVQAVVSLGYETPTPVQTKTIPLALAQIEHGVDLMVSSQTGSGKTAAFLLPLLQHATATQDARHLAAKRLHEQAIADALAKGEAPPKPNKRKNPRDPRHFKAAEPLALVLCPTRELAQQVAKDAIDLVRYSKGLRIASVVGGMPYGVQIAALQNATVVVATPGRLLDLNRSGELVLSHVQTLIIDEADRMLDLGFADDLEEIHHLTSHRHHTQMFSATFAPRIQQLGMRIMREGGAHTQRVQIHAPTEQHANITQRLYWTDDEAHRQALLVHWLATPEIEQAIVFANTQVECDALAEELHNSGWSAIALHGALSQGMRNRRLNLVRQGKVRVLVATDVAARGLDVPSISHVFNMGLPMKSEDYTHRIGRTGRAGRSGLAITFAMPRDQRRLSDVEFLTKQRLDAHVVAGLEPRFQPRPTHKPKHKTTSRHPSRSANGHANGNGNGSGNGFGRSRSESDFHHRPRTESVIHHAHTPHPHPDHRSRRGHATQGADQGGYADRSQGRRSQGDRSDRSDRSSSWSDRPARGQGKRFGR